MGCQIILEVLRHLEDNASASGLIASFSNLKCRAELAIPPWQLQLDAIVQTNKTDWEKRPGHAFWQGGSETCLARQELWKCEDNDRLR